MIGIVLFGVILAVTVAVGLTVASRLLVVCGPDQMLVIAGRGTPHGRPYSVLRGGRMIRLPGLQRVFRLPLGTFEVGFSVRTRDRHHVPLTIDGTATLRIGDEDREIDRAVTRLLGLDQAALTALAARQGQATVSGIVPQLEALQIVDEPRLFQERLTEELAYRASTLGLRVASLAVTSVRDDGDYIDARQAIRRARR